MARTLHDHVLKGMKTSATNIDTTLVLSCVKTASIILRSYAFSLARLLHLGRPQNAPGWPNAILLLFGDNDRAILVFFSTSEIIQLPDPYFRRLYKRGFMIVSRFLFPEHRTRLLCIVEVRYWLER